MCDQADRKVHTNTRRTEQNRTEHKEWKKRKKERKKRQFNRLPTLFWFCTRLPTFEANKTSIEDR